VDSVTAAARAKGETAAAAAAAFAAASSSLSRFDSSLGLLTRKFTNLIQVRSIMEDPYCHKLLRLTRLRL
jgi:hypothetical protein